MEAGPDYYRKYYDQVVVVSILTDQHRKERKSDAKNSGQLNKFNYQKKLYFYASLPVIYSTLRPRELTNP